MIQPEDPYSTIVLAIATVILALATIALAYFTYMLYVETKRMRLIQTSPDISIFTSPESSWRNLIDLSIKNTGSGTAYNVTFSINSEFLYGLRSNKLLLRELPLIKNGLSCMSAGQEFKFFLLLIDDYKDHELPILDLSVSYKDADGNTTSKNYKFDFSIYRDLQGGQKNENHEIAENLRQITLILREKMH
jgi:hypothetical protein